MTKKLLEWKEGLIKQGDERGSTPLHFAASWRFESMLENSLGNLLGHSITSTTAKLLLDAYESSAYQADHSGSFPIQRDAHGRTFLHIAAVKGYTFLWLHYTKLGGNLYDARLLQRRASITKATPHYTLLPWLGSCGLYAH